MNELQIEKLRDLAKEKGFEECQDSLVEACETLIEAAEGEDYDDFIDSLANVTIVMQQVIFSLLEEYQKQLDEVIDSQITALTAILTVPDEDDPDNEPF